MNVSQLVRFLIREAENIRVDPRHDADYAALIAWGAQMVQQVPPQDAVDYFLFRLSEWQEIYPEWSKSLGYLRESILEEMEDS